MNADKASDDEGYFWETDIGGWILMFLVLNNVALWLADPIAHISIAWT